MLITSKAFAPSLALPKRNFNLTCRLSTDLPTSIKDFTATPTPKPTKAFLRLKTEFFRLSTPLVADCIAWRVLSLATISIFTFLVATYRLALSNRSCLSFSSF